jgi:hypothetical protein
MYRKERKYLIYCTQQIRRLSIFIINGRERKQGRKEEIEKNERALTKIRDGEK